ncbi:hypothetical protein PVL29_016356 [Vitis rotundifolia]|uniref:Uncharacterized protein n=1 Tax=Vitis rotundifolia TaxID=103349 RepID=A0AA38Z864_VITRO|nr:hypothetical protein PVL29_016356 [Vitis rotundifolia]
MSRQNTIVRLHNAGGQLRGRVNSETQFRFLPIIHRKTLQKQRSETRASPTTNSMEDKEPLKPSAVVNELSDSVKT